MSSYQHNQILHEALQSIGRLKRARLDDFEKIAEIEQKLISILDNSSCSNNPLQKTHKLQNIATANGCKLSKEGLSNINKDDFDIILDMTTNSLRCRKDPVKRTELKESQLENIGSRRIEILSYLLEHPKRNISVENVSLLSNQMDFVSPNTLAKTISLLRKALGQKGAKGPYIITEPSLGSVQHIYKLNPKMKYLVIRGKI
jgi:hypothetical protein